MMGDTLAWKDTPASGVVYSLPILYSLPSSAHLGRLHAAHLGEERACTERDHVDIAQACLAHTAPCVRLRPSAYRVPCALDEAEPVLAASVLYVPGFSRDFDCFDSILEWDGISGMEVVFDSLIFLAVLIA